MKQKDLNVNSEITILQGGEDVNLEIAANTMMTKWYWLFPFLDFHFCYFGKIEKICVKILEIKIYFPEMIPESDT
jgi:hypothetical protein